jgi:hypothetical protein
VKALSLLLILFFAASVAGAVDSFDYHCANIALLQDAQVRAEVGISEAQRTQMNKFADAHRARLLTYQKKLAGKAPDMQVLSGYLEDLKRNVVGTMTAPQVKRLRELNLQAANLIGLLDQTVAAKIGMVGAQFTKYKNNYINGKNSAENILRQAILPIDQKYQRLAAPYKGKEQQHKAELEQLGKQYQAEVESARKAVQPRVDAITKQTQQQLQSSLTPQEISAWNAIKGKPFHPKKQ